MLSTYRFLVSHHTCYLALSLGSMVTFPYSDDSWTHQTSKWTLFFHVLQSLETLKSPVTFPNHFACPSICLWWVPTEEWHSHLNVNESKTNWSLHSSLMPHSQLPVPPANLMIQTRAPASPFIFFPYHWFPPPLFYLSLLPLSSDNCYCV